MPSLLPLLAGFGIAGAVYGGQAVGKVVTKWAAAPRGVSYAKRFYEGGFYSPMTKREAALILGVRATANRKQVLDRYRTLMRLNHPDHGGSPFMAQKVNEAKELLIQSKKA